MKSLIDLIKLIVLVTFVLALVFLFQGKPDVWDKLHERAMSAASIAPAPNGAAANPASVQREKDGGTK